ncbi:hypothetical protein GCM10020254_68770 [Streptomyces goshikiensis]
MSQGSGGREGGAAQVDHGAEGLGRQGFQAARGQRVPRGYGGPAAGAPAGFQEPLAAQRLVGGGDGGAAEAEGDGEFPLGGQPGGDGDAAFEDEQPDAVGEGAVRGRLAGAGHGRRPLLGADEAGELCGTDRRGPLSHAVRSTFVELAPTGPRCDRYWIASVAQTVTRCSGGARGPGRDRHGTGRGVVRAGRRTGGILPP